MADEVSVEHWKVKQVFPYISDHAAKSVLEETDNDPDLAILMLETLPEIHTSPPAEEEEVVYARPMTDNVAQRRHSGEDGGLRSTMRAKHASLIHKLKKEEHRVVDKNRRVKSHLVRRLSSTTPEPSEPSEAGPEHVAMQQEVAARLAKASEAPLDFFGSHSRLMITTKRRMMQLQEAKGIPEREACLAVGQERIKDRLGCLGLREVKVSADGNCQFRAFAFHLHGTSERHDDVRQAIVKFMSTHRHFYTPYFDGDAELDAYLARQAKAGVWGDEMTLKACCDCFQVAIHIVMSTGTQWYHRVSPGDDLEATRNVAVSYICGLHYNPIVLAESGDNYV